MLQKFSLTGRTLVFGLKHRPVIDTRPSPKPARLLKDLESVLFSKSARFYQNSKEDTCKSQITHLTPGGRGGDGDLVFLALL